jgi:Tfp pilus assembly protein PilV
MLGMLRREDALGLAEVLVSLVVLVIIVLATYAALDGPSALSGQNKARTVAAALAEQDQERMRAFKATDLSNYFEKRDVTVSGVKYTIESRAVWTSDASGTESCSSSTKEADFVKISSTVTWPSMSGAPVRTVSVVAPPSGGLGGDRGNLVVQLTDQAGAPVEGMPMTISPATATVSTNSVGCAYFGHIPAGSYQARFAQPGWVTPAGLTAGVVNGPVTTGTTTTLSGRYARAAEVAVSFDTKIGSADPVAAQAVAMTVVSPELPAPGTRTFTTGRLESQIRADSLFPFTAGYGVYAGSCPAADPTAYIRDYWARYPGYVTPGPGGSASVKVRAPALRARVTRGGTPLAGAHMVVRATGVGCTDVYALTTASDGYPQTPGLPFGTYSVCADDGVRRVATASTAPVQSWSPDGSQQVTLDVPRSGTGAVCT